MVNFLEEAIELKNGKDFSKDERNLIVISFKNLIKP
jgi:hypothetical protein